MPASQPKTRRPVADRSYQILEINDLSGGLDLRRSPTLLQSNRARVLKNYSLPATPENDTTIFKKPVR